MGSKTKWVVLTTYPHAVHYGWDNGSKFLNPEQPYYTLTATVKQDGCVDIHRYYDGEEESSDYIHVCDLPEFIQTLQELVEESNAASL